MTELRPQTIALVSVSSLAVLVAGWACYFDYRRRNDSAFRLRLLKERKALEQRAKKEAQQAGQGAQATQAALVRALAAIEGEKPPATMEEGHAYFLEQVSLGEQLAKKGPEFYVASAICLFKAMRVYPEPQELAGIYQQTQPAAVFALVVELLRLDTPAAKGGRKGVEDADGPLLEEVQ